MGIIAVPAGLLLPTLAYTRFRSVPTDSTMGEWDDTHQTIQITGGNHAWPSIIGPIKSSNSGFADGHVETRPREKLQWQVEGRRSVVYLY